MLSAVMGQTPAPSADEAVDRRQTTENGVLVVRHESRVAEAPADTDPLVVALQNALAADEAQEARTRPRLTVMQIAEPWRYNAQQLSTTTQQGIVWQSRQRRDWTYHPTPRRDQAEVRRLTRYRPTQP